MAKVKLNFVKEGSLDGEVESVSCEVTEGTTRGVPNGEIVCKAPDGRMVKFPEGTDLAKAVKAYNEANK